MTCALPISAGAVALGPLEPLGPGAPRVRPAQRSLGALAPAGARRRSPAARPALSRRQEPRRLRCGTRRRRQRQKARPSVAQRGRKPMTRKRKKELETQGEASPEENRLRRRLEAAKEALERIRKGEAPTADELATAPLLQFWCIVVAGRFPVLQEIGRAHV